jgi:hypothetical protein
MVYVQRESTFELLNGKKNINKKGEMNSIQTFDLFIPPDF